MGYDIVVYKNKHRVVIELSRSLHAELFAIKRNYKTMNLVNFLEDFYRTNHIFEAPEIKILISELKNLSVDMNKKYLQELENILKVISEHDVIKIHVISD